CRFAGQIRDRRGVAAARRSRQQRARAEGDCRYLERARRQPVRVEAEVDRGSDARAGVRRQVDAGFTPARRIAVMSAARPSLLSLVQAGLGATALALTAACEKPAPPPPPPPPEVYFAEVAQRDVPEFLELVGQAQGFQDVDIRARVEG